MAGSEPRYLPIGRTGRPEIDIAGRSHFPDRRAAGRLLAGRLLELSIEAPVVVALPRGGVPVADEVARALGAPLDIVLVRKLGAPDQPELGIGALGEGGTVVLDQDTIAALGVSREQIEAVREREAAELERRRRLYRGDAEPLDVSGRIAVVVDDGIATGVTTAAACRVLDARGATRVLVAVPVCSRSALQRLGDVVCLQCPRRFRGVGAWYEDFTQTTDEEVVELLRARS